MVRTARVPEEFRPAFEAAEAIVGRYFEELARRPEQGSIETCGERYVLVRAASLSVEFFSIARQLYGASREQEAEEFARAILFDIAHAIGKSDARAFHEQMSLVDPIAKLSAGPIHFAHSGWAFVDIMSESKPVPDESCFIVYDHPYSFEADAWLKSAQPRDFPVCIMNAGYSSGWTEESFGLPLVATEVSCRANGDPQCRFVMAPPQKIQEVVQRYVLENDDGHPRVVPSIPDFFARTRLEEELRRGRQAELERAETLAHYTAHLAQYTAQLRQLNEASMAISSSLDVSAVLNTMTEKARDLIGAQEAEARLLDSSNPTGVGAGASVENCTIRTERELSAPLVAPDGENLGFVRLADKRQGAFTPEDESLLEQLARMASIAIENARLYRELEQSDRRKDEFLAMLSHELRNPLGAVSNAVQLLKIRKQTHAEEERVHQVLERQVAYMGRLLGDLLDLSRITRGNIELKRSTFDVGRAIDRAVDGVDHLISERRHTLVARKAAGPLIVNADPTRIEQIVANLLHNAAKYTPPGGHIEIVAGRDNGSIVIRVKDDGFGICPTLLPQIFEPFVQGEPSRDTHGGLGVGLTMVHRLTELHGGTVTAKSDGLERGSEFEVRLPEASPAAEEKEASSDVALDPTTHRHRVLIVDDQIDAAGLLAELVAEFGHQVRTASNGLDALRAAREFLPTLVLLDIGLPDIDGYEVARRLHQEPSMGGTLVVALTGYGRDADRERAHASGFDDHVVKPVDLSRLKSLLDRPLP